ncbi:hypothetical protein [Actinomadura parmotrematis]|uniref:RICIN domain-containing protein n=1 Tax=Actinomadura parmotrematis TaxID=2864039 RepID=A0ABS7FNC6_9ACTN|nr:hypothetical protein [Actinomadura parmotrematis]MBW8481892.1 hypothetical protein [Actinomadura parmotrematis]
MRSSRATRRTRRASWALRTAAASAACAVTAMGLAVSPAAAAPAAPAAQTAAALGQTCTAADLGQRHPIIKNIEVSPTITHFTGWYVTAGTTGTQTVTTSTETTIAVSVGLNGNVHGSFAVEALGMVGASAGLNVKVDYTSTSTESQSLTWNFLEPGYYGLYKGTKKVTGTYGSLNCNRVQQSDGGWALKWVQGPDGGDYTTYTTLEEGAVRCQDTVPANSIMAKAQGLLDCAGAAAKAQRPAGAVAPTAKQLQDRRAQRPAPATGTDRPKAAAQALALNCSATAYKIAVPGQPLSWGGPLLNDGVRLRPSSIFSAHLDNWRLCNTTESNGVIEATLWNWGSGGCATIAAQDAGTERAVLNTASCTEDDLQRFYIYRDVPGSDRIGVQNKYTGSMMGHDRYADGEFIRQYSSGRQDGTGTYSLLGV